MKKLIVTALALALLLCGCEGGGKTEETTAPPDGTVYEYSSDGSMKTAQVTYKDGVEIARENYSYNSVNGKIEKVEQIENGETVFTTTYAYEYSKETKEFFLSQQAEEYTDDGAELKDITSFDETGLPLRRDSYENEEYIGGEVYHYNENDHLIKTEQLDAGGRVATYFIYDCDAEGNILMAYYYEFGSLAGTYKYNYDENGDFIGYEPVAAPTEE